MPPPQGACAERSGWFPAAGLVCTYQTLQCTAVGCCQRTVACGRDGGWVWKEEQRLSPVELSASAAAAGEFVSCGGNREASTSDSILGWLTRPWGCVQKPHMEPPVDATASTEASSCWWQGWSGGSGGGTQPCLCFTKPQVSSSSTGQRARNLSFHVSGSQRCTALLVLPKVRGVLMCASYVVCVCTIGVCALCVIALAFDHVPGVYLVCCVWAGGWCIGWTG